MNQRLLGLSGLLIAALSLPACGSGVSTEEAAQSIVAVMGSISTAFGEVSGGSQLARIRNSALRTTEEARKAYREGRFTLNGSPRSTLALEEIPITNPEGLDCTLQLDADTFEYAMNCTTTAEKSSSCGSDTYTLASGFTMSFTMNETEMAFGFNGEVSGGGLGSDPVDFDCNLSVSLTAVESGGFDCTSSDFSCSIGGTTYSCEDLNSVSATCE